MARSIALAARLFQASFDQKGFVSCRHAERVDAAFGSVPFHGAVSIYPTSRDPVGLVTASIMLRLLAGYSSVQACSSTRSKHYLERNSLRPLERGAHATPRLVQVSRISRAGGLMSPGHSPSLSAATTIRGATPRSAASSARLSMSSSVPQSPRLSTSQAFGVLLCPVP